MSIKIGIIAEDDSDVKIAEILLGKIKTKSTFQIKKFVGRGCGKISSKCRRWAVNLGLKGCTLLALIHDLDKKNESQLRADLLEALQPCPISKYVVVIPVRELEAWLLADHSAINKAMRFRKVMPKVGNPHAILNPKERLGSLIYSYSEKRITYVNTIHNIKIAEQISLATLT